MSTDTQVCDIALPGYTLVDRIGAGGYAEVWRAEAPGGIQKAVKVVYGYYDDEFASQELKALERVKDVRHPFLLSLERFEILNGRLAILTELADMSLDQRRQQCCAEGLSGIPRDELMRYMSDAAEALDFLAQRHSLLHLDIKPENLLILGDHIKVADFGLVKEIASRTQNSLVSGLTPTYASPEMFDDGPTTQSDQYSLAIVYQQMLVGTLPFPGRTVAQLAKQHSQAEPQLTSLPAEDRVVVARALAKKPADRFSSCRAFVDALMKRGEFTPAVPVEIPRPRPAAPVPAAPDPDDTKPPSFCTTLHRDEVHAPPPAGEVGVTQPVRREESSTQTRTESFATPFVPEEMVDVSVPEIDPNLRLEQPTLYVAIGGVGIQILCRMRALVAMNGASQDAIGTMQVIALDTDREELREACSSRWTLPLASEDTLHVPLRLPKSYDDCRDVLGWVSRRWLYNIPRSLETRGYRPLGRVALVDHAPRILPLIDQKLERLADLAGAVDAAGVARDNTVKVVLLVGTGGGTGAGTAIDVANAVKARAEARTLPVEVDGLLICTCLSGNTSSPLAAANTYSLLTELNHATNNGNESRGDGRPSRPFESRTPPFDHVYCVPTHARTAKAAIDGLDVVAKYLALERVADARGALRSCRVSTTPREQLCGRSLNFKKLGYASLADQKRKFIKELADDLAGAIKRFWLSDDESANWQELVAAEERERSVPKLAPKNEADPAEPPVVVPVNDSTPLALRGRFKEHMGLEFTSEVLRQIQRQLDSRDEHGRPLIQGREAKWIADAACDAVTSFVKRGADENSATSRFSDSVVLRSLVTAGSRRVLERAVEKYDARKSERFLPIETIDQLLEAECEQLLDESFTQPDLGTALTAMLDVDQTLTATIEQASTDLLQCGGDRRTLVFVPRNEENGTAVATIRASRPLAAVVPCDVDDVVVVSEDAGISPKSLALGLERVFPGVADAAQRLLTRMDIEWQAII